MLARSLELGLARPPPPSPASRGRDRMPASCHENEMLLRIMNPFQQCHLVMLRSLYEYEPISDDADPIEIEMSSMLWNRISMFLHKRKALQDTTERLKDIQDSLMEAKLLKQILNIFCNFGP